MWVIVRLRIGVRDGDTNHLSTGVGPKHGLVLCTHCLPTTKRKRSRHRGQREHLPHDISPTIKRPAYSSGLLLDQQSPSHRLQRTLRPVPRQGPSPPCGSGPTRSPSFPSQINTEIVIPRACGVSSTLWPFDSIADASEYWIARRSLSSGAHSRDPLASPRLHRVLYRNPYSAASLT
jgi:hypothetical protein